MYNYSFEFSLWWPCCQRETFLGLYMGHSRPNWTGWNPYFFSSFSFSFIEVCYGWPQKNVLKQFSNFFETYLAAMVKIAVALRALIDSFKIYEINCLIKKKIFNLFPHVHILGGRTRTKKKISRLRWNGLIIWIKKFIQKFFIQIFFSTIFFAIFSFFTIISHYYL